MKFLVRFLNTAPDQIFSTFIIVVVTYIFYRGIVACFNEPPRVIWMWIALFIGIIFGILNSFKMMAQENEKKKDNRENTGDF